MVDAYSKAGTWFDRRDRVISNVQNSKKFYDEFASELELDPESVNWGNVMINGYLDKDRDDIIPKEFAAGIAQISSEFGEKKVSYADVSVVASVPINKVKENSDRIRKSMKVYPLFVFAR